MPTGRTAAELQIYDPVLTMIARQYVPMGFVYDQICPTIPVDVLSGQYPVFDERYFFGDDVDNKIADRGKTPEIELVWSTDTYMCEDYGLKISITPRERQQARGPNGSTQNALRLETSKTKQLITRMKLRRERRLAALLRSTRNGGLITTDLAATAAFARSTTIETDWKAAKLRAYNLTGIAPNVAVVPYEKAYDMATNATLRDIWKYTLNADAFMRIGSDASGEDLFLPRVFQGTRLIVPKGALYQQGKEGAAKSLTDVWGSSVRFLYVDPDAAWGVPSTAYQFSAPTIIGMGAATGSGFVIDRWNENDPKVEYVRATEAVDEKICAPDTGVELTGV